MDITKGMTANVQDDGKFHFCLDPMPWHMRNDMNEMTQIQLMTAALKCSCSAVRRVQEQIRSNS